MKNTITFRKAEIADSDRIWQIILQAKEQMRLRNSRQWQDGYPAMENIVDDIQKDYGHVLCLDNAVIAYGAIIFVGEPAYDSILGNWLSELPYVVVHRLAVADEVKNRGVATLYMQKVAEISRQKGVRSFRVDTNFDNLYIRKMLQALDFTYCGEIFYDKNSRLAYEKLIF